MTSLTRGANSPIDTVTTTVEVTGARQGTIDLFVFQLGADLKVRTDADLVFFNNPSTPEGAVTLSGGRVTLNLGTVPTAIDTLAVAVALDENVPGGLAQVPGLAVTVTQTGGVSFEVPAEGLTTERSAVLLEVYRRNGSWKVRNRSAGWGGGLDALVTEHGVSVDETPAHTPTPTQAPEPAQGIRTRTVGFRLGDRRRARRADGSRGGHAFAGQAGEAEPAEAGGRESPPDEGGLQPGRPRRPGHGQHRVDVQAVQVR